MPERDGYMHGVPCWIDTTQPDPQAAVAFYGGLFGWTFEDTMPTGSDTNYFIARLRGGDVAAVGSQPQGGPPMATWNTYIWVDNADAIAAKVQDTGGRVVTAPYDVMDAGRTALFTDHEGAAFSVWQAGQHRGARIVNEAGSLNFNGLNTRDVDGAKAFYGAVFGWQATVVDGAGMWRLPGYGDFLELSDPELRKRMAEFSAPEGFEDVVATINPIAEGQAAYRMSVTLAVDDADATATGGEPGRKGGRRAVRCPW